MQLTNNLAAHDVDCELVWLDSTAATRGGARRWLRGLDDTLRSATNPVVFVNYAAHHYGSRGIPFYVIGVLRRCKRGSAQTVLIGHELARPWGERGWRGAVQALAHRVALYYLFRQSAAVVVMTERRADWLRSRRWLPRTRICVVPVMSTVAPLCRPRYKPSRSPAIGIFGFSGDPRGAPWVISALRSVQCSFSVRVRMIGAPGRESLQGEVWALNASSFGVQLDFTGVLEPDALSAALSSVDVLVFPDLAGPSARRTTLANALAHGLPVVAFDGPETWPALRETGAVDLVPVDADRLASRLSELLSSEEERQSLGGRARQFHDEHLAPPVVATRIAELLSAVWPGSGIHGD